MIDAATRGALVVLFVWVVFRSLRIRPGIKNPSRRRSLVVMAVGSLLPIGFWLEVSLTSLTTPEALDVAVWLSRLAFASLAVTLLTLQAFIRDAENGQ